MFDIPQFDPNAMPMPVVNYPAPFNAAPALTGFGGAFSAASQFAAGQNTASLLRANAGISGLQARGELEAGAEQAELYRQHLTARLGAQQAGIGGAGVTTSGSALRGLETTVQLGAQDLTRINANAARRAWGFDVTQQGDLARAQLASNAGTANALGGLITSGSRAYGQWMNT